MKAIITYLHETEMKGRVITGIGRTKIPVSNFEEVENAVKELQENGKEITSVTVKWDDEEDRKEPTNNVTIINNGRIKNKTVNTTVNDNKIEK